MIAAKGWSCRYRSISGRTSGFFTRSALLMARMAGSRVSRSVAMMGGSSRWTPAGASTISRIASTVRKVSFASLTILRFSGVVARWIPGVSMKINCPAARLRMPMIRLRVVWGLRVVMAIFSPTIRFSSVDFPTLGRPTMPMNPDLNIYLYADPRRSMVLIHTIRCALSIS